MKVRWFLFVSSLFFCVACENQQVSEIPQKPEKTYVVVCFDVEDYITPEDEDIDGIPKWLAETMTEVGVPGTFFVIGEKARSLEERGRKDVIEGMAKFDIESHTNMGSIHPTVTELLEKMSFREGIDLMKERESIGFTELERIFGKPIGLLARHGGSYGPQLVAALAEMGAGYVYSPISLPGHEVVWFCNTLNFHGEYGGFDDTYFRDDLFNPRFEQLKQDFTSDIQGVDVLNFFACHPCKVRTVQFWDFNYYKGANPDPSEWKIPELRPAESMHTARKNFRRLMQFLKDRPDIELTDFSRLMQIFSYQREEVDSNRLVEIARRILDQKEVVIDDLYSPAETFAALARMIDAYAESGVLPSHVERMSPYGPVRMPVTETALNAVTPEQAFSLAKKARLHIENEKTLPHKLIVSKQGIGTGSLLALFSEVFLDLSSGRVADRYQVRSFPAYPTENEATIIAEVEDCKNWPVHRPDLNMSNLVEMTRLQLWTIKPAWPKP